MGLVRKIMNVSSYEFHISIKIMNVSSYEFISIKIMNVSSYEFHISIKDFLAIESNLSSTRVPTQLSFPTFRNLRYAGL